MKYEEITHSSHPQHKLKLNYTDIPFKCNGCKEIGIGSHYNCSSSASRACCDYDLHTHCAVLKPSIAHPFYPDCSFQFLSHPPGSTERYCNACERRVSGFLYHCRKCGFDLHPCCARLPMVLDVDGKVKLNLYERVSACCQSCGRKGRSWSYKSSCSRYSLHVACVKEMIMEYQSSWREDEVLMVPNLKETLQMNDHYKKGKKKKQKNVKNMVGMAVQFVVSAILGDPTALLAGVVATLISKS